MNKKNQADKLFKETLKKFMEDSYRQDDLYTAGNYWKHYEKKILKQVNENYLPRFRSWEGGAGVGNIQSFGGGSELKSRKFLRNFHPIDDAFSFIDDSLLVQKYNSLINKILPYIPFFKYFLIRIAEAKKYYKDMNEENAKIKYNLIKNLDERLTEISDSSFGLDQKELVYINGKIYTNKFLSELTIINYIKKNTEFESIKYIIELGAGIGLLASAFLKLNNKIKYLIVDIPPTICFSQYFLSNIGYKVFGYEELAKEEKIDINKIFEDYDVICLPAWKLNILKDFSFDLFINVESMQEMEKRQALNYFSVLKKNLSKYIYIDNLITGHHKAVKKKTFGVLEETTLESVEDYLSSDFKIIKKDLYENEIKYQTIFEKK